MSCESVPQEFLTRVTHRSVPRERPTRLISPRAILRPRHLCFGVGHASFLSAPPNVFFFCDAHASCRPRQFFCRPHQMDLRRPRELFCRPRQTVLCRPRQFCCRPRQSFLCRPRPFSCRPRQFFCRPPDGFASASSFVGPARCFFYVGHASSFVEPRALASVHSSLFWPRHWFSTSPPFIGPARLLSGSCPRFGSFCVLARIIFFVRGGWDEVLSRTVFAVAFYEKVVAAVTKGIAGRPNARRPRQQMVRRTCGERIEDRSWVFARGVFFCTWWLGRSFLTRRACNRFL